MPTKTLLEITQDILSEINGDDVNSIFDTEEAEQVARIVISNYNSLMSKQNWPHMRTLFQLIASGDNDKPTHMTYPSDIKEFVSIAYDIRKDGETRKKFTPMKYLYPDQFLYKLNLRDNTSSTVKTVTDTTGVELYILNNTAPTYYTSFDDATIVFDAYDVDVEDTLTAAKTQCVGFQQLVLSLSDTATPNLPVDIYSLLFQESLSTAQFRIKEIQDVKAEQEAGSQGRALTRKNWKVNRSQRYPNFGKR